MTRHMHFATFTGFRWTLPQSIRSFTTIPSILLSVPMALSPIKELTAQTAGQQSSPGQLVQALHTAFGDNHSRAVHAKGIVLEGVFTPDKDAAGLTKAFHLQQEPSKVTVRFSDFTGIPNIPDNNPAANPRGMAIKFRMADGRTTDLVTHSFNGFPTENSDQFRELLLAIAVSDPAAATPTRLNSFLAAHPIAKTFLTTQKNPASYGAVSYFGVNAYKLTNAAGRSHFVRYRFIPVDGEELLTPEQLAAQGPDYLVDEIKSRVTKRTIRYKMYAQLADPGDKIADPSIAWPENRTLVLLGTMDIQRLSSNTPEQDKALFFIPNNIPDGISTADPMLDFRSKAYPISVEHRQ